jgi:hypothetical protein
MKKKEEIRKKKEQNEITYNLMSLSEEAVIKYEPSLVNLTQFTAAEPSFLLLLFFLS